MNKQEALEVLENELAQFRRESYVELRRLLKAPPNYQVTAPSGQTYQVEVQVFWDNRPGGNLRVMGSIDDGGLRAFFPLSSDFIIGPDGSFVGE